MPKRVLVVHQLRAPGSYQDRSRGEIYAPEFRRAGFDVEFVGRHPYALLEPRGRVSHAISRSIPMRILERGRDRIVTPMADAQILRRAKQADIVILIKCDSPTLVAKLKKTGARVIYDLCDQVWRDGEGKARQDIFGMLSMVDAITVNSDSAYAYAKRFGPPVHMWAEAAYVEAFDERRASSPRDGGRPITLGWIGSSSTVPYLWLLLEALEEIGERHDNVQLRLVGVPENHDLLRRFETMRVSSRAAYDKDGMIEEVLGFDVGLYPMFDIEESRVHGLGKALIYMAGGAVVVGSPVRDRKHLIEHGVTGFLADGRREWVDVLDKLVVDGALRARVRAAALERVRRTNSLARSFDDLRPVLE